MSKVEARRVRDPIKAGDYEGIHENRSGVLFVRLQSYRIPPGAIRIQYFLKVGSEDEMVSRRISEILLGCRSSIHVVSAAVS